MSDDVEAFEGELRQLRELNGWGFIGPCAHGRDPFTRCDTCERLTPLAAALLAEREACAVVVERLAFTLDMAGGLAAPKHHRLHDAAAAIRARGAR